MTERELTRMRAALNADQPTRKAMGIHGERRIDVSVSRRITAPAAEIFRILTVPANHPALDGSGMLRHPQ